MLANDYKKKIMVIRVGNYFQQTIIIWAGIASHHYLMNELTFQKSCLTILWLDPDSRCYVPGWQFYNLSPNKFSDTFQSSSFFLHVSVMFILRWVSNTRTLLSAISELKLFHNKNPWQIGYLQLVRVESEIWCFLRQASFSKQD